MIPPVTSLTYKGFNFFQVQTSSVSLLTICLLTNGAGFASPFTPVADERALLLRTTRYEHSAAKRALPQPTVSQPTPHRAHPLSLSSLPQSLHSSAPSLHPSFFALSFALSYISISNECRRGARVPMLVLLRNRIRSRSYLQGSAKEWTPGSANHDEYL